jgi:large subunit ribosomal protein L18
MSKQTQQTRLKRKMHIRKTMSGSAQRPRLTVFRSNKHIHAQLIDDVSGLTLVSASDVKIEKGNGIDRATIVGSEIASLAKKNKLETVVFDRNGYRYHGRVKALADAARAAGLKF